MQVHPTYTHKNRSPALALREAARFTQKIEKKGKRKNPEERRERSLARAKSQRAAGLKEICADVIVLLENSGVMTHAELSTTLINRADVEQGTTPASNLMRRLYDALNALETANVLRRENGNIYWIGTGSVAAAGTIIELRRTVQAKDAQLQQLHHEISNMRHALATHERREIECILSSPVRSDTMHQKLPKMTDFMENLF